MPYAKLLTQLIEAKGLTIKEVADRCTNLYEQKITAAYISIIKNSNDGKIPSDDVSRALAKACEAENIEILVIEAYIDRAPQVIRDFLESIRALIIQSISMFFMNSISNEEYQLVLQGIKNLPLADLILHSGGLFSSMNFEKMANGIDAKVEMIDETTKFFAQMKEPEGLKIKDNSMFPKILEGSKVTLEALNTNDYNNGDIIVVTIKGQKKTICRSCFFNEDKSKVTLLAYDHQYAPETYTIDEILILGKVKRIITEL